MSDYTLPHTCTVRPFPVKMRHMEGKWFVRFVTDTESDPSTVSIPPINSRMEVARDGSASTYRVSHWDPSEYTEVTNSFAHRIPYTNYTLAHTELTDMKGRWVGQEKSMWPTSVDGVFTVEKDAMANEEEPLSVLAWAAKDYLQEEKAMIVTFDDTAQPNKPLLALSTSLDWPSNDDILDRLRHHNGTRPQEVRHVPDNTLVPKVLSTRHDSRIALF